MLSKTEPGTGQVFQLRKKVQQLFETSAAGLRFTMEHTDAQGSMRFLSLRMHFCKEQLCGELELLSKKALFF